MADMGSTPENRREAQPHQPMTQQIAPPVAHDAGGVRVDADPNPQIRRDESTPGTPLPLRPARAAANNRRYGGGSETASPTIPEAIG